MKRPLAAALALLALAAAAPAGAQEGSITISPALFEGISKPGQRIGPLTITNTTRTRIDVEVLPVLLEQRRDGGVSLRQDEEAEAEALRLLRIVGDTSFTLAPGKSRSVRAVLRGRSDEENFYGGILFEATPRQKTTRGSSITQVFQLNARVLLRPPKALTRPAFELTGIRGEQSGEQRIRLLTAFGNSGNITLRPRGSVRVLDELGQERFRGPLSELDVFPGAEVELAAELADPVLPAGKYEVEATVRAGGHEESVSAPLELFGPNELPTRKAELVALTFPQAYADDDLPVTATYRNTGNVPFAPRAMLVADEGKPIPMATAEVAPGTTGTARASVHLAGLQSRTLTVTLFAEGRELDARTASVTPVPRPSLADRLQDWILAHALLLVGGLAALVLAMMATLALVLLRRGRRRGQSDDDGLELLARLPTVNPPPRPQQPTTIVPRPANEQEGEQAAVVPDSEASSRHLEAGVGAATSTAAARLSAPEPAVTSQQLAPRRPDHDRAEPDGTTPAYPQPALETPPEPTGSPVAAPPGDVLRHRAEPPAAARVAADVPGRRAPERGAPSMEAEPIPPEPDEAERDGTATLPGPPARPLFDTPSEWSGPPAVGARRSDVPARREEPPPAAPPFNEAPTEPSARPATGPNERAQSRSPRASASRVAPEPAHGISTGEVIVLTGAAAVTLLVLERLLRR